MWRWIRTKLLLVVAIVITTVALYKRLSNNHSPQVLEKKSPRDLNLARSPKISSPEPLDVLHKPVVNLHGSQLTTLYQKALDMNFSQKLHNTQYFGDHSPDSIILVVQVHDRPKYFQEFLNSLKHVRNVEQATLVISMDKFSDEMKNVISSIAFCRYMVIFFPFSMQLFPNSFPGEDPNDCPRDISKAEAIAKKCNNADHPDLYGHYREVKYVQIKHHWLWKLHMVFKGIKVFANSQGPVILLEEDYFLVPDILVCASKAVELKNTKCTKCGFISLGNYEKTQDYSHNNYVEVRSWVSSATNMGMVITRDTYNLISDCTNEMCDHDDYNWDWSLQAAVKAKFPTKLFTIQFKATRVYHLGTCNGMHAKKHCELSSELDHIRNQIKGQSLYPESLHVAIDNPVVASMPKPNGGWGDSRDRALCKTYSTMYDDQ